MIHLENESKSKIMKKKEKEREREVKLEKLFDEALLENRSDFVAVFLEHRINLSKYLDDHRLKRLYNNELVNFD